MTISLNIVKTHEVIILSKVDETTIVLGNSLLNLNPLGYNVYIEGSATAEPSCPSMNPKEQDSFNGIPNNPHDIAAVTTLSMIAGTILMKKQRGIIPVKRSIKEPLKRIRENRMFRTCCAKKIG